MMSALFAISLPLVEILVYINIYLVPMRQFDDGGYVLRLRVTVRIHQGPNGMMSCRNRIKVQFNEN